MKRTRVFAALAVGALAVGVGAPGTAGAAAPSCVGQAASAPTSYPREKADFVTFFAGPGYGGLVSAYAQQNRSACPPLPTPG